MKVKTVGLDLAKDAFQVHGISENGHVMCNRAIKRAKLLRFFATHPKHATGEVLSSGGYLRGMVEKARAGDLHLERSFYGRLSGQAA